MNDGLSEVGHQANQCCIPFVWNFSESCWATCHQNLSYSIFKSFERVFINSNEGMGCDFFSDLILKLPNSFFLSELFLNGPYLGQKTNFKTAHWEEKIRIILRIDRNVGIFPMNGCNTSRQSIFNLPEDTSSKVHIMLHQPHSTIFGPAFPIIIANNILIVWIRIFC